MGFGFSLDLGKFIDRFLGYDDDPYEDWRLQQEYNTPARQMERLIDAGLNPNLIYGNISNTATSPIRARQGSNVTASFSPNPPNVDIQKEAIQAQIDLLGEREEGVKLDNDLKRLQVEYFRKNGTAPGVSNLAQVFDRFINFFTGPVRSFGNYLGNFVGSSDVDSSAYEPVYKSSYAPVEVRKGDVNYDYSNFSYYGYTPRYRR